MPKLTDLPLQAVAKAQQLVERGSAELHYAYKMLEAGAFKLEPPQNIAAMLADIRRWGEFGMIPALSVSSALYPRAGVDPAFAGRAVAAARADGVSPAVCKTVIEHSDRLSRALRTRALAG